MYRFFETVYRRVPQTPFYIGIGYHFSNYQNVVDKRADQGERTPYTAYQFGYPRHTTASGLSANVLYESRDNTINATRGLYWNASIRGFPTALGSDDHWQSLWSDLRVYPHVPRGGRNVLALWNYVWLTFGHAPYLDLPAIGWDTYGRGGRGYIQGRIRGRNQTYNEAEYRMTLSRDGLWGMVGFLSLMATTGPVGSAFQQVDADGVQSHRRSLVGPVAAGALLLWHAGGLLILLARNAITRVTVCLHDGRLGSMPPASDPPRRISTDTQRSGIMTKSFVRAFAAALLAGALASLPTLATASSIESEIELLRSDLRAGKVDVVKNALHVAGAKADAFWPLYRKHPLDLDKIGVKRI